MAAGARGSSLGRALQRAGEPLRREPRPVPAVRAWRTGLRTAHLLAAASLYGGHVHGVAAARLVPALSAVFATGVVVAHMPGRWRSHSLLYGAGVGPEAKG